MEGEDEKMDMESILTPLNQSLQYWMDYKREIFDN